MAKEPFPSDSIANSPAVTSDKLWEAARRRLRILWPGRRHGRLAAILGGVGGAASILLFFFSNDVRNVLYPEYLVAPQEEVVLRELIRALNPGIFPLKSREYVDVGLIGSLEVRVRRQYDERKRCIIEVEYPDFFANSSFLVDRVQMVLGKKLSTTRAAFFYRKRAMCATVIVNGEEIALGKEGFALDSRHFCRPPSHRQEMLSSCRLGVPEAVKMQKILNELRYYSGEFYEGVSLDEARRRCVYEWEGEPAIVDALRRFQAHERLHVDGKFGRNTRIRMRRVAEAEGIEL